jgi:hypothetical protein
LDYAALDAFIARLVFVVASSSRLADAKKNRPTFFADFGVSSGTPDITKLHGKIRQPLTQLPLHLRNAWDIGADIDAPLISKWVSYLKLDRVNESKWPLIIITCGSSVLSKLRKYSHTPHFVVCAGGCLHNTTVQALEARRLKRWGVHKAVSVWALRLHDRHVLQRHVGVEEMAALLLLDLQRDVLKAYTAVGSARFKLGYSAEDFSLQSATDVMPNPSDLHLDLTDRSQWRLACTRRFPDVPVTLAASPSDPQLTGIEISAQISDPELTEREEDLALWRRGGQKWIDAFLPEARKRVQTFLNDNSQTNRHVAELAHSWLEPTAAPFKFGKVEDLIVTQDELRPGARGRLWEWQDGKCFETVQKPITNRLAFNVENVGKACDILQFPDKRAVQMLLHTGGSHGTTNFPLDCYGSRNHQGAASFPATVSKLIKSKIEAGHMSISDGCSASPHPLSIPFGVLPLNGSEANLKEDQFYNRRDGMDWEPNVRPTFDGSSPHSEGIPRSINAHTILLPEENMPWSTIDHVEHALRVLLSIGCEIRAWKVDLEASYFQIAHQETQLWRQNYYHVHHDGTRFSGGYYREQRGLWGGRKIGEIFHRTFTSITVLWIEHQLLSVWLPTISCPITLKWIDSRRNAGLSGRDLLPSFVSAFLDDTCIFLGGSLADIKRGYKIVMDAFAFLGWSLSLKKMALEGTPDPVIIVLGHGVDCQQGKRFVTMHKQDRIRDTAVPAIQTKQIEADSLASLLGLIQSVRGNVTRRWRLSPLYAALHHPQSGHVIHLHPRAIAALQRVVDSLSERRSIWLQPPHWQIPTFPLVQGVPNSDASQCCGMAGSLLDGPTMRYFSLTWPESIVEARVDIPVLEGIGVLYSAAIWGAKWRGRNVVLRCDNSTTCYAFNTLKTHSVAMATAIDVWEAIQFRYGFSGLLVHCPDRENTVCDTGSRRPSDSNVGEQMLNRYKQLTRKAGKSPEVATATRTDIPADIPDFGDLFFDRIIRSDRVDRSRRESKDATAPSSTL